MHSQIQWSEHIKDHIELMMWRGGNNDRAIVAVTDEVVEQCMDNSQMPAIVQSAIGSTDSREIGGLLQNLVERELATYCVENSDELQERFPEQWADFKDIDNGDEVDT